MKNTKLTKIFVLVIALALLIGSVVGIAISAAETPEIIGKNIRYGADLKFRIAVSAENLGTDKTVTVNIYDVYPEANINPVDTVTAEYTDTSSWNLGVDNAYVAVAKYGISAIAMGQTFYITAECDGAVSEVLEYSAVEYFLERLYADDIINATAEDDLLRKEHYENAIAYGSTAQKVTGDAKTNVADYVYVGADGGNILVDGNSVGSSTVLAKGTSYTIQSETAVAAGYVAIWKDGAGNSYQGGKTITANGSALFTSTLLPMLTFDGMNEVTVTVPENTSTSSASQVFSTFGDDWAAYNKAFKIYNGVLEKNMPTASIVNEQLVVNTDDGSDYIKIYPTYTETGYNHTTFEADLTFNCNTGNIGFDLLQSDNSTAVRFSVFTYNMSTGYFKMNATNASGGTGNTIDITLPTTGDDAHKLNIKVDHYKLENDIVVAFYFNGTLKYIIDSRLATDETTSNIDSKNTDGVLLSGTRYYPYSNNTAGKETVKTDFSQFSLNPNSNFSGSISFDNIIFMQTVTTEEPDYNTTLK